MGPPTECRPCGVYGPFCKNSWDICGLTPGLTTGYCAVQCADPGDTSCGPGFACVAFGTQGLYGCWPVGTSCADLNGTTGTGGVTSCATASDATVCELEGAALPRCCNGTCVDVASDPLNCGRCNAGCPDTSACLENPGSGRAQTFACFTDAGSQMVCSAQASCPAGYACDANGFCLNSTCGGNQDGSECVSGPGAKDGACCGSTCLDIQTDPNNCGGCGVVCESGEVCSQGHCAVTTCDAQSGSEECLMANDSFGRCCGTTCVHLASDANNCGSCGVSCGKGNTCSQGTCFVMACTTSTPEGSGCWYGDAVQGNCCGTECTNYKEDSANCGSCGNACASGSKCVGGACT